MFNLPDPICVGCGKEPCRIEEYKSAAREYGCSADHYVQMQEGTYNPQNGHFLCTECYIEAGMPSSPQGWVAP